MGPNQGTPLTQDGSGGSFNSVQLFVTPASFSAACSKEAGRKHNGNITSAKRKTTKPAAAAFGRSPPARASARCSGASAMAIKPPHASTKRRGFAIKKQAKRMPPIARSATARSAQKLKDESFTFGGIESHSRSLGKPKQSYLH